jgi:DNA-binding response OmpR family regulator
VLVVDDDEGVRTVVTWQLEAAGYATAQARDGLQALELLGATDPVLVVLDLSSLGGMDVLRRIRDGQTRAASTLPVIVLSGRNVEAERIIVLDQGADDYLIKPFSPGELAARVRSVLRRSYRPEPGQAMRVGPLTLDQASREVTVDGQAVALTAREFDLLAFLIEHPRRVFTRGQLLTEVWKSSSSWQCEATVTEHVHRLRGKLEPGAGGLVRTVRGVGYQLDPAAVGSSA